MSWWLPHNFEKKGYILKKRARILGSIRNFFDSRDYTEVDTPALQICPVMDTHIHAFETNLYDVSRTNQKTMYLHTSPEFDMKKLLSAGMERIYQICHVYRNAEGSGLHSPEFMLLEWYQTGKDYTALMEESVALFRHIAKEMDIEHYKHKGQSCDPFGDWERLAVTEAFEKYTNIDLISILNDRGCFAKAAMELGVRVIDSDAWDDIFHAVMSEKIEPNLGQSAPTILYDYPVSMAALSRKKRSDPRFAERFELYICGIELANAFSELTDPKEQRERYNEEMRAKKALYGEIYPPDDEFFNALEYLPDSAGIALGIDRLVMLATDAENINDVLWAPVQGL